MPAISRIVYVPGLKPPSPSLVSLAVPLAGSVSDASATGSVPTTFSVAPASSTNPPERDTWLAPFTLSVAPPFTVTARATESPALTTAVPASHTSGAEAVWLRAIVSVPAPADVTAPVPPKLAFNVTFLSFLSMTNPPSPTVNHFASSDGATMPASLRNTYRVPPPNCTALSGRFF